MFESYEVLTTKTPEGGDSYFLEIKDSDFTEIIQAYKTDDGLDVMTPLIFLYKGREKNVAANIAKAYVYLCKRFKLEPQIFLERMIKLNKSVAEYKEDIEKYLLIL